MNQFIRFPIQIISSGIIEFMQKGHFRVYASIDSHKDRKTGQAFPSLQTIRKETKLDRHTIQGAIKDLIEWDLMKKAYIKKKKGRGYRIVYTLIKEPQIKKPLKKVKEKMSKWGKQKRDSKGRFTDVKQPNERTFLNVLKQPNGSAIIHPKKSKQPNERTTTIKPNDSADPKAVDSASIQCSLSSSYLVKKDLLQNNSHKGKKLKSKSKAKSKSLTEEINLKPKKPKLDTSEKAWTKGIDNFIGEKKKTKKTKWPNDKREGPLKETISTILKAR